MIRKQKRDMWDKFVQDAEGKDMWKIWKMTSTKRTTMTPTIVDPATLTSYTTFDQKERMFFEKLFPEGRRDQVEHQEGRRGEWREITEEEAQKAIGSQGQHKAAGEDEITAAVITETWRVLGDWITRGYNGMMKAGYHPQVWRRAIGAIIPKPNKPNYAYHKSYRPISLLATLGKGLEKIAANKLTEVGEEGGLHQDQWGGRKGRSAETCIAHLVDRIEDAHQRGKKVTIIALDIAQAFPSDMRNRLANTLRDDQTSEELVQ